MATREGLKAVDLFQAIEVRKDQGAVDHGDQPRRQPARRRPGQPGAGSLPLRRRIRLHPRHRHDGLCRRASPGHRLGREGRHRHQFRTPHFPPARASCPIPARPSPTGGSSPKWRPAWAGPTPSPTSPRPTSSPSTPPCPPSRTTAAAPSTSARWPTRTTTRSPQRNGRPKHRRTGTARLFAEGGFPTPDARARFVAVQAEGPATSASAEYPFILNTGRIRDQWHTMTRTGLVPRLSSHIAEPFVAVNPTDAAALNLTDDDLAVLRSSHGQATLRVRVTPDQPRGQLFAPMHWNRRFSGNGGINALTAPVTDAISGQPELKHTPASLTPFKPAWTAFLITRGETVPPPSSEYWSRSAAAGCTVLMLAGTTPAHRPRRLGRNAPAAASRHRLSRQAPRHPSLGAAGRRPAGSLPVPQHRPARSPAARGWSACSPPPRWTHHRAPAC